MELLDAGVLASERKNFRSEDPGMRLIEDLGSSAGSALGRHCVRCGGGVRGHRRDIGRIRSSEHGVKLNHPDVDKGRPQAPNGKTKWTAGAARAAAARRRSTTGAVVAQ